MELNNKKYIKNTGNLPKFEDGLFTSLLANIRNTSNYALNVWRILPTYLPVLIILTPTTSSQVSLWEMMKNNSNGKSLIGSHFDLYNNPGIDPKSKPISRSNISGYGDAIMSTVNFAGDFYKSLLHNYSTELELRDAGQSENSIGGVSYETLNPIDKDQIRKEMHKRHVLTTTGLMASGAAAGAGIGSLFPGAGTVIGAGVGALAGLAGGIFSGGEDHAAKMRAVRNAEIQTGLINNFNRSGALTTAMQQDYSKEHGDTRSQFLYGAKDGKISSAVGPIDKLATAKVSNGEIIANKISGTMYRVPGKKNNKDSKLAYVKDSDTIITNKYGLSDYVAATGDVEGAEQMMKTIQYNKNLIKACNGKLPKFEEGWVPNVISSGLGFLGGMSQYLDAKRQSVKNPNTYSSNPYEQRALSDLYSLQVNPYPILPELYNQYAKTMSAIDRSGGLSGGQRTLSRIAAMNNTLLNTAKLLSAAQEQNNTYRAQAANAALNAGNARALRRMQANQFDLDYYSKAYASRQQGMQMGIYNMLNQLQQYYANDFKRRLFNDAMGLFNLLLSLELQKLLHDLYGNDTENYTKSQIARKLKTPLNKKYK